MSITNIRSHGNESTTPNLAIPKSLSSGSLPASESLVRLAHSNWLACMRRNENQPSREHQDAGWQLLRAMVDQLYGERIGRYAYALPCGAGKTESIVALLAAMFALKVFGSGKTVLVVAQQVTALCAIKQKLISAGVPELTVGIVHSKPNATFPTTDERKFPIMLATHARLQRDGSLPDCCFKSDGSVHDLVIWDEALISTDALTLTLDSTLSALRHFAEGGKCSTVAEVYKRLGVALEREKATQQAGQSPCEMPPAVTELEAELMQQELRRIGYLDTTGQALREQCIDAVRLLRNSISLLDSRYGGAATLIRYVVKVPDAVVNIVILDASHAIDELRQADSTIRAGTTQAMGNFKNFGNVTATHYPVASGRYTMLDGKAISEAVRIARQLPLDSRVLFVTFKDWHESRLKDELKAAGLSLSGERTEPDGKPGRHVITWGKHTSANSYTDCNHVVLVGLLRLPRQALASQLAAQRRDLTHRRDMTGLIGLERSVIAGDVMQAMNRGCMRLTDAEGKARSMNVHIIARDDLRELLQQAMPGLQWKTLEVKAPTKTEDAARLIVEYLSSLPDEVLKISLKSLLPAAGVCLAKDAKAEAVKVALILQKLQSIHSGTPQWVIKERSLVRKDG